MTRAIALRLLVASVVASLITSSGCGRTTARAHVSTGEAERLVQAWITAHRDQGYWHDQPTLREVTTQEVRRKLQAQVFRLTDEPGCISEFDAYLIKDGKVYPMSTGLGGHGLMGMCVCDIDRDSKDELVYVYSWGSGLHRSVIEAYRFGAPSPTKILSTFAVKNADVILEKTGPHSVGLYVRDVVDGKQARRRLGQLVVARHNGSQLLDVELEPNLPKKWRDNMWRLKAP